MASKQSFQHTGKLSHPVPDRDGSRVANFPIEHASDSQHNPQCWISIQVLGVTVKALLDSGATDCFVGPSFFDQVPGARDYLYWIEQPVGGTFANNQRFVCTHALNFDVEVGKDIVPVTAYFSPSSSYTLILGYNFLREGHIIVDFRSLNLKRSPDAFVKSSEKVELPPHTENIIKGYLTHPSSKSLAVITSSHQLTSFGLMCANCLVDTTHSVVPVKILNPTEAPVIIPKHFRLGVCEPASQASIRDVDFTTSVNATSLDLPSIDREQFFKQFDIADSASQTDRTALLDLLWQYRDIFPSASDSLGCTDVMEFKITLRPDSKPLKSRPYRSNPKLRREISRQLQQMLDENIIRPSTSQYVSPVLLVEKADGSLRFVTDFRRMNAENIVPEPATLPRIDCSLESIGSSQPTLFTTLDMLKGFWQVPIEESSKQYTAFITHDGVFEYNRMPFGLANSPACFMRLMTSVLQGLMWEICLVYIDDIIVFSKDFSQHLDRLQQVFDRIRAANLKLKPKKCAFLRSEIKFLGHIISAQGLHPLPDKIKAIEQFPPPSTMKEVQAFLGLVGYYRKFIKGFAEIAGPLHKLTKKDTPFQWNAEQNEAFLLLRTALLHPPILAYPNYERPYVLETDASAFAVGFVLSQEFDGHLRPIAYSGRRLNGAQQNYSTTEKEALAVVLAFQQFDSFLRGNKVHVITDHVALKWLLTQKSPGGRLARWIAYLQQFNFTVEHKPGKAHAKADCLSRIQHESDATSVEATIDNQIFPSHCNAMDSSTPPIWSPQQLRKAQMCDLRLQQIIDFKESETLPQSRKAQKRLKRTASQFALLSGVLYYNNLKDIRDLELGVHQYVLVVPPVLRFDILASAHGDSSAGHFGIQRTFDTLRLKYFWPGMYRDVTNWVKSCEKCNRIKPASPSSRAMLQPLPVTHFSERWSMDLIGMPESPRGNRWILTFIEYNTRYAEVFALPNAQAETIARILVDEICFRYGAPGCILSDLGQNLVSKVVSETCKLFSIDRQTTTAYHPQCNGLLEKFNATLCKTIAMFVNPRHDDWDLHLRSACHAYNTSVCVDSTHFSPFYLMYGVTPRAPIDTAIIPPSPGEHTFIGDTLAKLCTAREIARHNIALAQEKMKATYDKTANPPEFRIGDLVWIYFPQVIVGGTKKFFANYSGPFQIVRKQGELNYEVAHSHNGQRLKNPVHVNRLKAFVARSVKPPLSEELRRIVATDDVSCIAPPDQRELRQSENSSAPPVDSDSQTSLPVNSESRNPASRDEPPVAELAPQPRRRSPRKHASKKPQKSSTPSENLTTNLFEIEKIIKKKFVKGQPYFFIKWKNHSSKYNSWEPFDNLNEEARDYASKF